ncbi:GntR family transcriptional regulator [Luteimonas sp. XNQY3]|nr:GntR family transcriptional regulator [Luteimonas sp. XNQY3]MCD9007502.1 GntR family transcriptional regulator [Luteimonas sp. XNQY3]
MLERHSRSAHVYEAIKAEVRSGAYPPGYPISAATLSRRLSTSIIPIREALNRLTGERLVEARDHNGFFAPRISEMGLRDLYHSQMALILCALDHLAMPDPKYVELFDASAHGAPWAAVERLFNALADASTSGELSWVLHNALDRLHPVYLLKQEVAADWELECIRLLAHWQRGNRAEFKEALTAYHARRLELVPALVERLNHPTLAH